MREFRQCLGRFATGVTVITCSSADGTPCGVTANSFSSVSLDPPLVLWNIAKTTDTLQSYLDARHFAIHVLLESQQDVSANFARSDHTLFDNIDYRLSGTGVPILRERLALLECSTHEIHDCGDHYIIVGHVDSFDTSDGEPLLFYGSEYRLLKD